MRKHDDCATAEAVLGKVNRYRKAKLEVVFSAFYIGNTDWY